MDKRIPVVVIKELSETEKILSALREYGINCAEITFRTACAKEAIALAVKLFPDMNVGAGTVINESQCLQALEAGAKFIVSPGLSVAVAKICKEKGVPYYPGCVTPTEIMQALDLGIEIVKRAIEEPLRQIVANAGKEGAVIVQKVKEGKGDFGYNARVDKFENFHAAGVIDPAKVTRVALENAASIAGMFLTTECVIADKKEETPAAMAPGMGGGMGGMM